MTERVLLGPFLTRAQAARLAGVPPSVLVHRPDLLHIGGRWLQEAYCGFQFDEGGVRRDIGTVVHSLKPAYPDLAIADWLVKPNPALNNTSPLLYLSNTGRVDKVLAAEESNPPVVDPAPASPPQESSPIESSVKASMAEVPARGSRRRQTAHQH